MALAAQSASLTAVSTGTTALSIFGSFSIGLRGTWVGTVELQRSTDDGGNWYTVQSFTSNTEAQGYEPEQGVPVQYRLQCTAYTSGTILARLAF